MISPNDRAYVPTSTPSILTRATPRRPADTQRQLLRHAAPAARRGGTCSRAPARPRCRGVGAARVDTRRRPSVDRVPACGARSCSSTHFCSLPASLSLTLPDFAGTAAVQQLYSILTFRSHACRTIWAGRMCPGPVRPATTPMVRSARRPWPGCLRKAWSFSARTLGVSALHPAPRCSPAATRSTSTPRMSMS